MITFFIGGTAARWGAAFAGLVAAIIGVVIALNVGQTTSAGVFTARRHPVLRGDWVTFGRLRLLGLALIVVGGGLVALAALRSGN
jgi:cbb3-type cytochrome oxidase subunit 1